MRFFSVLYFIAAVSLFYGSALAQDSSRLSDSGPVLAGEGAPAEDDFEEARSPFAANEMFTREAAPTAVKVHENVVQGEARLEGIAIGPLKRMAVISGQTYAEGETKQNVEVISVRKAEVDVKQGSSSMTLLMNETDDSTQSSVSDSRKKRDDAVVTASPGMPPMNF